MLTAVHEVGRKTLTQIGECVVATDLGPQVGGKERLGAGAGAEARQVRIERIVERLLLAAEEGFEVALRLALQARHGQ